MYIPPLDALLFSIGLSRELLQESEDVKIPTELFRFLIKLALVNVDFNENDYLECNPDVAKAMKTGSLGDVRLHYIGNGYFEGRTGATPPVDERWYLQTYPDVSDAVRSRRIQSGAEHFKSVGAAELRAPSAEYERDAVEWGRAMGKSSKA